MLLHKEVYKIYLEKEDDKPSNKPTTRMEKWADVRAQLNAESELIKTAIVLSYIDELLDL